MGQVLKRKNVGVPESQGDEDERADEDDRQRHQHISAQLLCDDLHGYVGAVSLARGKDFSREVLPLNRLKDLVHSGNPVRRMVEDLVLERHG